MRNEEPESFHPRGWNRHGFRSDFDPPYLSHGFWLSQPTQFTLIFCLRNPIIRLMKVLLRDQAGERFYAQFPGMVTEVTNQFKSLPPQSFQRQLQGEDLFPGVRAALEPDGSGSTSSCPASHHHNDLCSLRPAGGSMRHQSTDT